MNEALMYAEYNRAANKTIYGLISALDSDGREKDRGSYYRSLSGLFRHVLGGTQFFLGMFRETLAGNAAAVKALSPVEGLPYSPEGALDDVQWKELDGLRETLDNAYTNMAETLSESDLTLPAKVPFYGGNPPAVPLYFLHSQLVVHNTHHRGQISQILDSLKIEHNFSGIDLSFMPR